MRVVIYSLLLIGIFAVWLLFVPRFATRPPPAPQTGALTQINVFKTAMDALRQDIGRFPSGTNGLVELLKQPADATNWHGPYLGSADGVPNDPWGRPFIYECPGKHNTNAYDLFSVGPDGRAGTGDDLTNWQNR